MADASHFLTRAQLSPEELKLLEVAEGVLPRAHSRYSHFRVAAAIEMVGGQIFPGVNVENISYGLTLCAESTAMVTAVTAGLRELFRVVVLGGKISPDGGIADTDADPITPCGACRQFLAEFAPNPEAVKVICGNHSADRFRRFHLAELLPYGFANPGLGTV